ncbi:MAG: hypothetical protein KIS87_04720 [Phycisphaeraceae bacterium]|nr:hypothetical protein [Phycisphaeraceae bacterium]
MLREDPDRLVALSGRTPEDVAEIIRREPEAIHALLRAVKGLRAEELARIAAGIEKRRRAGKRGPVGRGPRPAPRSRSVRAAARVAATRRTGGPGAGAGKADSPAPASRGPRRSTASR